jgi:hypothetical protein
MQERSWPATESSSQQDSFIGLPGDLSNFFKEMDEGLSRLLESTDGYNS